VYLTFSLHCSPLEQTLLVNFGTKNVDALASNGCEHEGGRGSFKRKPFAYPRHRDMLLSHTSSVKLRSQCNVARQIRATNRGRTQNANGMGEIFLQEILLFRVGRGSSPPALKAASTTPGIQASICLHQDSPPVYTLLAKKSLMQICVVHKSSAKRDLHLERAAAGELVKGASDAGLVPPVQPKLPPGVCHVG